MTDPIERQLRNLLDERARGDPLAARHLADGIADLPPRRRPIVRAALPFAAAAVVVLAVVVAMAAPRLGGTGEQPTPAASPAAASPGSGLPGGPDAFAGDPRLLQCYGPETEMEFVFVMDHSRDYRRYLPAMGLSPELDVDEPAFAVVFRDGWEGPPTRGDDGPRSTPAPGLHFVCVIPEGGAANLYGDVDITGLTIDVVPSEALPSPIATNAATPEASITPPPAPAWVADLAGQLECDGPVTSIGGEVPETSSVGVPGDTPDAALASFLGPGNPYASLPAAGYEVAHLDTHWATYAHAYLGRVKTVIVLNDTTDYGDGWLVVGLRACDPSEFDPSVPLTFPVTIWTDASGKRMSTEIVRSGPGPAHCGWDSAIWLDVGGNLYFRDPAGVMDEWSTTPFEPDADLPAGAVDTGFRTGEWSLWLDPDGDAYLVSSATIERWPRSTDPFIGCV
jgi:hypothetical protein